MDWGITVVLAFVGIFFIIFLCVALINPKSTSIEKRISTKSKLKRENIRLINEINALKNKEFEEKYKNESYKKLVDNDIKKQYELISMKKLASEDDIKYQYEKLNTKRNNIYEELHKKEDEFNILFEQKTRGFPWLADAYAEYNYLNNLKISDSLKNKERPALKASEEIKNISKELRNSQKLLKLNEYKIKYYESLFPHLLEFWDNDEIDEYIKTENSIESKDDQSQYWLSESEYKSLPTAEKFQLALDRYIKSKKTNWQIGRDFERYIGYLYETQGYSVFYHGAIKGFEDLGRDIIATKNNEILIIQCKYWSKDKTIHEKHVFQLYGTIIAFEIDNPKKTVKGILITSTNLSDVAKKYADKLNIIIKEKQILDSYPLIKCNISRKTGEKIYHLPFDQQYDKITIEQSNGECYCDTISKAEELGFRRAFKWIPE